jgi:ABC-type transporter Mla subunit MlaD
VLVAMGVVTAVATSAGCGGSVDKTQPCNDIQQEIRNLVQTAADQVKDPEALGKSLRDSAAKIRDQGAPVGGDVKQASDDAAKALEQVADRLAEGPPQQSDLAPLVEAGSKIGKACTPAPS